MSNLTRFDQDGITIYIDVNTGESFVTERSYAKMANITQQAVNKRCKGDNSIEIKKAEILTPGGLQGNNLLPAELVFRWLIKDNPELAIAMGTAGATLYLHQVAGYKKQNATDLEKRVEFLEKTVALLMDSLVSKNTSVKSTPKPAPKLSGKNDLGIQRFVDDHLVIVDDRQQCISKEYLFNFFKSVNCNGQYAPRDTTKKVFNNAIANYLSVLSNWTGEIAGEVMRCKALKKSTRGYVTNLNVKSLQ